MNNEQCLYLPQLWTHRDPEPRGGHGAAGLHEPNPPARLRHPGQTASETNTAANLLNVNFQNNSKHVFLFFLIHSFHVLSSLFCKKISFFPYFQT